MGLVLSEKAVELIQEGDEKGIQNHLERHENLMEVDDDYDDDDDDDKDCKSEEGILCGEDEQTWGFSQTEKDIKVVENQRNYGEVSDDDAKSEEGILCGEDEKTWGFMQSNEGMNVEIKNKGEIEQAFDTAIGGGSAVDHSKNEKLQMEVDDINFVSFCSEKGLGSSEEELLSIEKGKNKYMLSESLENLTDLKSQVVGLSNSQELLDLAESSIDTKYSGPIDLSEMAGQGIKVETVSIEHKTEDEQSRKSISDFENIEAQFLEKQLEKKGTDSLDLSNGSGSQSDFDKSLEHSNASEVFELVINEKHTIENLENSKMNQDLPEDEPRKSLSDMPIVQIAENIVACSIKNGIALDKSIQDDRDEEGNVVVLSDSIGEEERGMDTLLIMPTEERPESGEESDEVFVSNDKSSHATFSNNRLKSVDENESDEQCPRVYGRQASEEKRKLSSSESELEISGLPDPQPMDLSSPEDAANSITRTDNLNEIPPEPEVCYPDVQEPLSIDKHAEGQSAVNSLCGEGINVNVSVAAMGDNQLSLLSESSAVSDNKSPEIDNDDSVDSLLGERINVKIQHKSISCGSYETSDTESEDETNNESTDQDEDHLTSSAGIESTGRDKDIYEGNLNESVEEKLYPSDENNIESVLNSPASQELKEDDYEQMPVEDNDLPENTNMLVTFDHPVVNDNHDLLRPETDQNSSKSDTWNDSDSKSGLALAHCGIEIGVDNVCQRDFENNSEDFVYNTVMEANEISLPEQEEKTVTETFEVEKVDNDQTSVDPLFCYNSYELMTTTEFPTSNLDVLDSSENVNAENEITDGQCLSDMIEKEESSINSDDDSQLAPLGTHQKSPDALVDIDNSDKSEDDNEDLYETTEVISAPTMMTEDAKQFESQDNDQSFRGLQEDLHFNRSQHLDACNETTVSDLNVNSACYEDEEPEYVEDLEKVAEKVASRRLLPLGASMEVHVSDEDTYEQQAVMMGDIDEEKEPTQPSLLIETNICDTTERNTDENFVFQEHSIEESQRYEERNGEDTAHRVQFDLSHTNDLGDTLNVRLGNYSKDPLSRFIITSQNRGNSPYPFDKITDNYDSSSPEPTAAVSHSPEKLETESSNDIIDLTDHEPEIIVSTQVDDKLSEVQASCPAHSADDGILQTNNESRLIDDDKLIDYESEGDDFIFTENAKTEIEEDEDIEIENKQKIDNSQSSQQPDMARDGEGHDPEVEVSTLGTDPVLVDGDIPIESKAFSDIALLSSGELDDNDIISLKGVESLKSTFSANNLLDSSAELVIDTTNDDELKDESGDEGLAGSGHFQVTNFSGGDDFSEASKEEIDYLEEIRRQDNLDSDFKSDALQSSSASSRLDSSYGEKELDAFDLSGGSGSLQQVTPRSFTSSEPEDISSRLRDSNCKGRLGNSLDGEKQALSVNVGQNEYSYSSEEELEKLSAHDDAGEYEDDLDDVSDNDSAKHDQPMQQQASGQELS
ncbi:uncharacterized protein LOC141902516 isoform X1 [Tubulanus polymorphus]|uniref:uncharacterized protein LOC141902516 isoform X1 n=1 Tax=Tubulanus polymorphus TaxID=672921 RepID=UPI003DA50094